MRFRHLYRPLEEIENLGYEFLKQWEKVYGSQVNFFLLMNFFIENRILFIIILLYDLTLRGK